MSNKAKIEEFRSIPAVERAEDEPAGYGLEWPQAVSQWLPHANYRGLVDGDYLTAAWRGRELKFREGWARGEFLCFGDDKTLMRRVRISSAWSHKLKFKEDLANASNNRLDRSRAEGEGKVFFEVLFYRAATVVGSDVVATMPVDEWIFANRGLTKDKLYAKAREDVRLGQFTTDDFNRAFQRVFATKGDGETRLGRPKASGRQLREPYATQAREDARKAI